MSKKYSEIVIEGSFMLVKGFLLGFLSHAKPGSRYFLHRKSGIRRETFKELLKEFFELDNYVHVCIEDDLVASFTEATNLYSETTGNKIKSSKKISSASFSFSYEFFKEDFAKEAKEMIDNLPLGVELTDYFPFEEKNKEGRGVEGYAPLHEFTSRAKGKLTGDFEGIMNIYLNVKKSDLSESILCSDVFLDFE